MKSLDLLPDLEKCPSGEYGSIQGAECVSRLLREVDKRDFSIECGVAAEGVMTTLFTGGNVPDDLQKAYDLAFSGSSIPLHDHYAQVASQGEESVRGFISALKGKLGELHVLDALKEHFPDCDWQMAADPTQPVWDIVGSTHGSEDILVQVKMATADSASQIAGLMADNPDVNFVMGGELYDHLTANHPELIAQMVDSGILNTDLTDSVHDNLELLANNCGIDVPDDIGDILPYIGEIVLGIRFLWDIIQTERDFSAVAMTDRSRVHGVKAIVLLSRFGVSALCTSLGGALGSAIPIPVVGTVLGIGAGAFVSWYLNRKLKPYYLEIALELLGLTKDDLFYFHNKQVIDAVGASLASTSLGEVQTAA